MHQALIILLLLCAALFVLWMAFESAPRPPAPTRSRRAAPWSRLSLFAMILLLLGLAIAALARDTKARQAAEAAQRAQQSVRALEAADTVARLRADPGPIGELVRDCIATFQRGRPWILHIDIDRRDLDRVRRLLRDIHPRDSARILEHATTPEMSSDAFLSYLLEQIQTRHARSGEAVVEIAISMRSDTILGKRDSRGTLECPLHGGDLGVPRFHPLYLE